MLRNISVIEHLGGIPQRLLFTPISKHYTEHRWSASDSLPWSIPSQLSHHYSPHQRLSRGQRVLPIRGNAVNTVLSQIACSKSYWFQMFAERSRQFMPVNMEKECKRRVRSNKTSEQHRRTRKMIWRSFRGQ